MVTGGRISGKARRRITDRLIVALDVPDLASALRIVEDTRQYVGMYKVGMELFYSVGAEGLRAIQNAGGRVFLDLKLHDIPNTVASAARVLAGLGVAMINVHCYGGKAMMRAARLAVDEASRSLGVERPLLVGVTVLTSLGDAELDCELSSKLGAAEQVVKLALLAKESGLDGVVASPLEISAVKGACGPEFIVVTPGIRPATAGLDDQKRVTTPGEALVSGADYLVIGRPITAAPDRSHAASALAAEAERYYEAHGRRR